MLKQYDIRPSMSRKANPYDNAKAESFLKTLQSEQIGGRIYATIEEARQHIIPFWNATIAGPRGQVYEFFQGMENLSQCAHSFYAEIASDPSASSE